LSEYDEGIKRNPNSVAIYSNRSATYLKLMEFNSALKDAEKCLALDPNFVKAYARKGVCHHMMKEYHKAMKAFEEGLKLDPSNKECLEGKSKTLMTI
jgi:stress-induced-phosphoprotein 1